MSNDKWYCEVQAPPELHEHIEQLFNAISYKIRHADGYIEGYKYRLEKSIEPNLGNNGSICTKTGSNDEDRTTDDCISRKQAIEAFEPTHYIDWYTPTIIETLEKLPSVRPEVLACGSGELVKESDGLVNDLVKDCISRQAVAKWLERWDGYVDKDIIERMKLRVIDIPSAQTERDIPIKPNETTDRAWGIPLRQAVCPKCDYYLGHVAFLGDYKGKRITYCETCGQAIDWEGWDFDE